MNLKVKSYVTPEGELLVVDPPAGCLPFLTAMNPNFRVRSAPPPTGFQPNLVRTRALQTGLLERDLSALEDTALWRRHTDAVAGRLGFSGREGVSLLDLKIELVRRELLECRLCGHECGVNRFVKVGKCGLRDGAHVAATFLHVAEEPPITPAGTIKLAQCGLRCAGCQSWEIIHLSDLELRTHPSLDERVWEACGDFSGAAAIEIAGGNPTENLFAVIKALKGVPRSLAAKPLVWNDHGYTMPAALALLDGIVDVYLPDLKGNSACMAKIAGVERYWERATDAIRIMTEQSTRIIVRLLVMPGHVHCCLKPAIRWLAQYRDRLWVSLIEFIPDHRALTDPALNRRTNRNEMAEVCTLIHEAGLRDVEEQSDEFWKG